MINESMSLEWQLRLAVVTNPRELRVRVEKSVNPITH